MDQTKTSGFSAEKIGEAGKLTRRFLCMTTAIAAVLPPSGRMLVFRDASGIMRDPWGQKYKAGGV